MARNFDADMDPFGGYETPSRSTSSGRNLDADMDPFGGYETPSRSAPVSSGGFRGYSQNLESYFDGSNEGPGEPTPVMSVPGRSTAGTRGGGNSGGGGASGFFSRPSSKSNQEEDQKEEDDKYDPLGFLGTFAGYAQATYDRAVDAFKAPPTDRTAAVNSVTDEYASALEKAAYESAMLAKERREKGFSVVPPGFTAFTNGPEVTTTSLDVPTDVLNVSTPDSRDPMSGLRESDLDMTSGMESFGNGSVAAIGKADEPPTVDTGVPAPAASGAGLMTRPEARQGLLSPDTTEQVKAAQSYLGVTSDGVIGKNTRGAIKGFQKKAGLPISGKLDAATKQAMQNPDALDPRDRPIATAPVAFMETKTFKLLQGVEGFKSKPYSLNAKTLINGKPHRSGLTVGAGIDFGQHTRSALEAIGLPKTMIDKAENAGWIGLNPDTIIDPATGKPAANREVGHRLMFNRFKEQKSTGTLPTFTEEELNAATPVMYEPYEQSARDALDARHGEGTYDSLDEGSKAVLTLEKYHRGTTYKLPNAMLDGAAAGDPLKAASGISWSSRSKNMKDWLSKVGLDVSNAPTTEAALNVAAPSTAATAPPTTTARQAGEANMDVRAIQSIVGTTADGVFGPMSRKSSIEYLRQNNVDVPLTVSNKQLMNLVSQFSEGSTVDTKESAPAGYTAFRLPTGLTLAKATRNEVRPSSNKLNISLDFNSFKGSRTATGTEVIIPDNASADVRSAAAKFNEKVVAFAAKHGYTNYKNRGVKTRSENKRGIRNTIHVEPFFTQDAKMEALIKKHPEEFAKLHQDAFGSLSATMVAPHGTPNSKGVIDKGATSKVFGNELAFGNMILDILLSNSKR